MKKFVDEVKIRVKAGDGGSGCVSFFRGPHLPKGGPDGGDGGRGGSIWLEASSHIHTLIDFKYKPEYEAKRGQHGRGKGQHGRGAEDITLLVPIGTIIRTDDGEIEADLTEVGQRLEVARGGRGGRGNTYFKSSTHQTPRESQPGFPGEERVLHLELRFLSDVGLVGFPNVGKSSLLASLTSAHPKIANYPFTTLNPQLGVMNDERALVMADLPGLIKGAHRNLGLGHRFLRHISRSRVLLVVVAFNEDCPLENMFQMLMEELRLYDPSLVYRPMILCVNKADLLEIDSPWQEKWTNEWKDFSHTHPECLLISVHRQEGIKTLTRKIDELVPERNSSQAFSKVPSMIN